MEKFKKTEMKIIEAYKSMLDNPYADGYTCVAFERIWGKIENARKLYERYLAGTRKKTKKYKVVVTETYTWEEEFEAESKEELEEKLEEEFVELFDCEFADGYFRDWKIKEVKDC